MLFFKKKNRYSNPGKIVVAEGLNSGSSEGYNRIRDNVLYMNADGNTKVIQVESSVSSEGKTTLVSNLAVSLGLTDKKVVLVDLDFRRPAVHRIFNLSKDTGIAEYIIGDAKIEDIVKPTEYKNVSVITRGAEIHNSSLVFVSEKFKSLISKLREEYDYVLLDCAPVLQVSDYIHISKVADGVLFAVAYASTTKAQASEAIKELKKNGVNVLGSVFTMYDKKKDGNYNAHGRYYYSYYNHSENQEKTDD